MDIIAHFKLWRRHTYLTDLNVCDKPLRDVLEIATRVTKLTVNDPQVKCNRKSQTVSAMEVPKPVSVDEVI